MQCNLTPSSQELTNIYFPEFLRLLLNHHLVVGLLSYKVTLIGPETWRLVWKNDSSIFRQVIQWTGTEWYTVSIDSGSFLSKVFTSHTPLRVKVEELLRSGVTEIDVVFG